MKRIAERYSAFMLIFTSIFGVLIALGGLYLTWTTLPGITRSTTQAVELMDAFLQSTTDLIEILDGSLEKSVSTFAAAGEALASTGEALHSTSEMTGAVGDLIGGQIASLISQTHDSLVTVQSSARLVDDTLGLISKVPLLGARYAPETSLEESITGVATSLETVPARLSEVQSSLKDASTDIGALQGELTTLSTDLLQIKADLHDAQQIMGNYQGMINQARDSLASIRGNLIRSIRLAGWVVSAVLVWLLLAQLGIFFQGLNLLQRPVNRAK